MGPGLVPDPPSRLVLNHVLVISVVAQVCRMSSTNINLVHEVFNFLEKVAGTEPKHIFLNKIHIFNKKTTYY